MQEIIHQNISELSSSLKQQVDKLKFVNDPDPLPFNIRLSFHKLIEKVKTYAHASDSPRSRYFREVLEQVEQVPALLQPIDNLNVLWDQKELVERLFESVFPLSSENFSPQAAIIPMQFAAVHANVAFKNLIDDIPSTLCFDDVPVDEILERKMQYVYTEVLRNVYGVEFSEKESLTLSVPHSETGLNRHFQVQMNNEFVEILQVGNYRRLTPEEVAYVRKNIMYPRKVQTFIDPKTIEFRGFIILELVDITAQKVLSSLKDELLERDALVSRERFTMIEGKIRDLFRLPDLQMGLALFNQYSNTFQNTSPHIWNSFISGDDKKVSCSIFKKCVYENLFKKHQPILLEDLEAVPEPSPIEQQFMDLGFRSVLIAPLVYEDEVMGIIELGSSRAGDLDFPSIYRLEQVLPIFSMAIHRSIEDQQNDIELIKQREFTAIHPTVNWKFNEVAQNLKERLDRGESAMPDPVVFKDVYPLYGQSDIRSSSKERIKSIKADLMEQLGLIRNVLSKILEQYPQPVYEELMYRVDKHREAISEGLNAGDENGILDFIRYEIEPHFPHFSDLGEEVEACIQAYKDALDPELNLIYRKRKEFEQSLTKINETVSMFLDEEEAKAQDMFPHYFEKYKTDGVEYNLYVGDSLIQDRGFEYIHLKNLRLWQLELMAKITRLTASLKPQLKLPLETTQLLLVHNAPLSIRFREDEKQFDVDGAYNIRYEIVKKRIDKAYIHGTNERLTQPGMIAIVYTSEKELREYKLYIEFLKNKGWFEDQVEYLDLEDLPGASGLKAIRLHVNLEESVEDSSL